MKYWHLKNSPIPDDGDYSDNTAWTFHNGVFTDTEIANIIAIGNSQPLESATTRANETSEYRKSEIRWLYPAVEQHEWIFRKLETAINEINDNYYQFDLRRLDALQFTRYGASNTGHYRAHPDNGATAPNRKLSFSVQLCDPTDYEGGQLIFHHQAPRQMPRSKGKIIFFPSYLLHEVLPVTKGTRYSLVGWVEGPKFK